MKVFISWSGEKSREIALALRDWLRCVISTVEPFVSSQDIDAGSRWQTEVAAELESTGCGVVCVTRENQSAPWLNFEAGALAKSVGAGRVIPLAIDLKQAEIAMPLGQFQAQQANKEGMRKVVSSINGASPSPLPDELLAKMFEKWWPDLRKAFEQVAKKQGPPVAPDARQDRELLEEVVDTVRSLSRVLNAEKREATTDHDFDLGDEVRHAAFGDGTIIGTEPGGVVIVRFEDGGERKLMAAYAPLSHLVF
jgi:hypothetical protein